MERSEVIALTFDLDFLDHTTGGELDEFQAVFPLLRETLAAMPALRATWFIRIDGRMEAAYGIADHTLRAHAKDIDWLRTRGDEIGWHHHAFQHTVTRWIPERDATAVLTNVRHYGQIARGHELQSARAGWGYHTNETLAELDLQGWTCDSSAVPRPRYEWDEVPKDWSRTSPEPYHPSCADYQVAGEPALSLLEVPLTTVRLPLPTDTVPNVRRVVNPAYHSAVFRAAVGSIAAGAPLVAVCHPYEILPRANPHPLLAFDPAVFRENLEWLLSRADETVTLAQLTAMRRPIPSSA